MKSYSPARRGIRTWFAVRESLVLIRTQYGRVLGSEPNLESHAAVQDHHHGHRDGEEDERRELPQREAGRVVEHRTECRVHDAALVCEENEENHCK